MFVHRRCLLATALVLATALPAMAQYRRGGHQHIGHRHHGHHHHSHFGFRHGTSLRFGLSLGGVYQRSYYGSGCSTLGYGSGIYSPYGTYYAPSSNYLEYYSPSIYAPAELGYGPQALTQFLGLGRSAFTAPLAVDPKPLVAPPLPAAPAVPASTLKRPLVRHSNPETLRRARKYVTIGDELFREARYHEALQQYKSAVKIAPDLAEAFFRQSYAYIATSRYEHAATAIKRGIALDPREVGSGFKLASIYGDAHLAKATHVEGLAAAALEFPDNSDLVFLLGTFFHFDDAPDRARKFLNRAGTMERGDDSHVRAFLSGAAPDKPAADFDA